MSSSRFLDRLNSGQNLVADGATGTNLQARGLERGLSSDVWVLENPEQITQLHRDFVAAGADIILTASFGGTAICLEHIGLAGRAAEINRRAVELAKQATARKVPSAGTDVLVAGSMGPTGQLLKPLGPLDENDAVAAFADQARVLTEAGVDLLVIETQFDLAEASAAIKGARSVSPLPLVVSFSYDRGTRTMTGVKPSQMGPSISALGVDVLGINCGRSLEDNLKALKELREVSSLPIWFKPNAGLPRLDEQERPIYDVTPEMMAAQVPEWLAAGARIVGGCCGTSPDHLRQIAQAVKA
jgi:5-methyltetrahydrofolate--homocysteine methyltransferase